MGAYHMENNLAQWSSKIGFIPGVAGPLDAAVTKR